MARRYPIAGRPGEFLPVATTRPETILGDTAVAVHPEDERYKQYIGMQCEVPMSGGRTVPIIGDEYVDREFGTGALKVTPGKTSYACVCQFSKGQCPYVFDIITRGKMIV